MPVRVYDRSHHSAQKKLLMNIPPSLPIIYISDSGWLISTLTLIVNVTTRTACVTSSPSLSRSRVPVLVLPASSPQRFDSASTRDISVQRAILTTTLFVGLHNAAVSPLAQTVCPTVRCRMIKRVVETADRQRMSAPRLANSLGKLPVSMPLL